MPDLRIEIVYALAHEQTIVQISIAPGSRVKDAVERLGIQRQRAPEGGYRYGIFGRRVREDQQLVDGDRIEIYRPLQADPQTARRARARTRRPARR